MRILVVEDETKVARALREGLEGERYEVETAATGEEGFFLASAQTFDLPSGKWHTLRIVQHGNRFEGYLNGKRLLEGTDDLFPKAGGVGLWTKADAVTSFDDLRVEP